ncbi:MAG TPA: CmcJ/NvfI family oxidoreductase [Rhizomicrobium sp.]|nr:CmcJ/NvfI family oxidoreductase [Rhizomicrobium sp.]
MSQPAATAEHGVVHAALNYIVDNGTKPVNETFGPGPGGMMRKTTGTFARHVVPIRDARGERAGHSLDTTGFLLADHPTRMKDFFDADELKTVYYREAAELIAAHSGARRVHVFDHTLRTGDEADRAARQIREPVKSVHNDYTEWSGPQRVRDLLPAGAETLIARRFAIIQVWRAIRQPVARDPLAIADARSLAAKDFIAAERRFPDRVGEIYQFAHNPAHRWCYFPRMTRDEALVFKVYDSAKDGRARWGAHTSFDDPASPANAGPRESIELRAFAFF